MLTGRSLKRITSSCTRRHEDSLQRGCTSSMLCRTSAARYSTESTSNHDDSIFSPQASPWDHVFEHIKDMQPLLPSSARGPRSIKEQAFNHRKPRRLEMTAREINAFDEMFDTIFNAVSASRSSDSKTRSLSSAVGIGRARPAEVNDLLGRLRDQSKRARKTEGLEAELDRKKEQMDLCENDQQLLEWAMSNVFGESKRYEENARRALEDPQSSTEPMELQPATYPHLISILMRTFRDKYSDPHLALSIFDHTRHLSLPSFVFGCTTPAYNELIETRWRFFRDLRGVCDALEEMRVNGVGMDNRTRSLAEIIRREVGERNLWQEESSAGSGEVWDMVARIEQLTSPTPKRPRRDTPRGERKSSTKQKRRTLDQKARKRNDNEEDDLWEFGRWDNMSLLGTKENAPHSS